jgi:hypothetical protein
MAARDMIARRSDYNESMDDFPTPPWATRALMEYVLGDSLRGENVLEPACGAGYMMRTLAEYGANVYGQDLNPNFVSEPVDFTKSSAEGWDWVITNPPYKHANKFFDVARTTDKGCALLLRIQWLTGQYRYNNIFSQNPPTFVAIFSRRMSAAQGKVVQENSPLFDHAWFVWDFSDKSGHTELIWIPPDAQKKLEKDGDYE